MSMSDNYPIESCSRTWCIISAYLFFFFALCEVIVVLENRKVNAPAVCVLTK